MTDDAEISVSLNEWESGRIASWAATNALVYMQHNAIGRGLDDGEKVEMERWKALSGKFRPATPHLGG